MSNFVKHLPWIAPTVAILAVGSGFLDRINISFDGGQQDAAAEAPVLAEPDPAEAALAAVATPPAAPVVVAPEPETNNAATQLAALLTQSNEAPSDVEVTRNQGFSLDTLEQATGTAIDAASNAQQQQQAQTGPVGADFFAAAQANIARDRQCIDDLRTLAGQALVYFPSGGLTADQTGLQQARMLGVLAEQCPGVRIQVEGHSDPSGNPVTNQQLSLERAQAVITRVAASGVDAGLFEAVGRGSSVPSLVRGPQPASFYDRRVEFTIIETPTEASFVAPTFGAPGNTFRVAACVSQLEAAVQGAVIEYQPRGMTITDADLSMATRLGQIAANCPDARLRIVGQHSDDPRAGEDGATGRLRAVVLMTKLVNEGIPAEQLIVGAPSDARPVAGLSNSRVDFQVIMEDL